MENLEENSFVKTYAPQYDELLNSGSDKAALLAGMDKQMHSPSLAFLKGGTVLGSIFALTVPFLQMVKPASKWQAFKATAPKTVAIGFAVGAVGNFARALVQNGKIEKEKENLGIMIDAVELERAKRSPSKQGERNR